MYISAGFNSKNTKIVGQLTEHKVLSPYKAGTIMEQKIIKYAIIFIFSTSALIKFKRRNRNRSYTLILVK